MAVRLRGLWPACLSSACLLFFTANGTQPSPAQMLPSDAFLSRAAADRSQPPLLGAPARALRVATLEWPAPGLTLASIGTAQAGTAQVGTAQVGESQIGVSQVEDTNVGETNVGEAQVGAPAFAHPAPLVLGGLVPADATPEAESLAVFGPEPTTENAYLELALDLVMSLPGRDESMRYAQDEDEDVPAFGPDMGEARLLPNAESGESLDLSRVTTFEVDIHGLFEPDGESERRPLYRDAGMIFDAAGTRAPPLALEYAELPKSITIMPLPPAPPPPPDDSETDGIFPSPALRLGLEGPERAHAEKCLAEAIYFESRGEVKRGQIAVAQVIMNRVFSGYYPNDVCKTVYQNANRHLACQFTFACDNVKDVIREPDMWVQAKDIASDMLDGKLWLDSVGRATHYHAYWVRPNWVKEMRTLDKIGVHTFYRPKNWGG